METSNENHNPAAEIDDALVRSTLRDQARLMGRIKLPKRGLTKSPIKSRGKKLGPFARQSRDRLRMARDLRWTRSRWMDGIFTQEELDQTRQMLAFYQQMEAQQNAPDLPEPSNIAKAVHSAIHDSRHPPYI